jgi:hypothetical protein
MPNHNELPEDLRDVAARLRSERAQASPFELDNIKLAAKSRAARHDRRGGVLRTRSITALVAMMLMAGSTGTVLAGGGGSGHGGNAGHGQYQCKDNNGHGKGKGNDKGKNKQCGSDSDDRGGRGGNGGGRGSD